MIIKTSILILRSSYVKIVTVWRYFFQEFLYFFREKYKPLPYLFSKSAGGKMDFSS